MVAHSVSVDFGRACTVAPSQRMGGSTVNDEGHSRIVGELIRIVRSRIYRECDAGAIVAAGDDRAESAVRDLAAAFLAEQRVVLEPEVVAAVIDGVVAATLGHGPLAPLLADPDVSEIMVNGRDDVWVERRGTLELVDVQFDDEEHIRHVVDRILAPIGRRLDTLHPMVDARLPDGSRVNAVIPPIALAGPTVTIRKFLARARTLAQLEELHAGTAEQIEAIRQLVSGRHNVVVCGPTSSGKTTILAAAMSACSQGERIVVIEDAAELAIDHEHCVHLEARPPTIDTHGAVTVRDLVRNALRMRPDRIIVGEVRGAEAYDLIQALSTGHQGSWSTVHAHGAVDALLRLESMALASGVGVPDRVLRQQLARSIDVVISVARDAGGLRRIVSMDRVVGHDGEWMLEPCDVVGVA
jgi:pilus assembly protein CpaF